jgi:hypothetical protein
MRRFTKGEPSRRLYPLDSHQRRNKTHVLVEQDLLVLPAGFEGFSNPPHTMWICVGSLQKPTVPAKNVGHAILRRPVEFCIASAIISGRVGTSQHTF